MYVTVFLTDIFENYELPDFLQESSTHWFYFRFVAYWKWALFPLKLKKFLALNIFYVFGRASPLVYKERFEGLRTADDLYKSFFLAEIPRTFAISAEGQPLFEKTSMYWEKKTKLEFKEWFCAPLSTRPRRLYIETLLFGF